MLGIKLICVGKMKEKHYILAMSEYEKRLSAFCKAEICELNEYKLPLSPSQTEIDIGLAREAAEIEKQIPRGCYVIAMCIEGHQLSSSEIAELMQKCALDGSSKLCFIVGSSFGLADSIKHRADLLLSMSKMTFPHHLARVMLAEQIYRGLTIIEGSKYHK